MSDEAATLARVQDIPSQALAEVLSRFGVHVAVLFGSAAKDRMRPDSDVDIAVLPSPDRSLSPDDELGLGVELDRLLGRDVDLVRLDTASTLLRNEAAHGRLIYEGRRGAFADFVARTMLEYDDLAPIVLRTGRGLLRDLARH